MGGNTNSVGPDFHEINVGFHCVKKNKQQATKKRVLAAGNGF
jgi:hypothetical protein